MHEQNSSDYEFQPNDLTVDDLSNNNTISTNSFFRTYFTYIIIQQRQITDTITLTDQITWTWGLCFSYFRNILLQILLDKLDTTYCTGDKHLTYKLETVTNTT